MNVLFRRPGVKLLCFFLCAVLWTLAIPGALGVYALLAGGEYEHSGAMKTQMLQRQLQADTATISSCFDPDYPQALSAMSGDIFSGQNSNFVYTVVQDDTGKVLCSTLPEGAEVTLSATETQLLLTATELIASPIQVTQPVFTSRGQMYRYSQEDDAFAPVDSALAPYLTNVPDYSADVFTSGFIYGGTRYLYYESENGNAFYPVEESTSVETAEVEYTTTGYLLAGLPYADDYQTLSGLLDGLSRHRYGLLAGTAAAVVLGLGLLILLLAQVAQLPGAAEPVLSPAFRLPPDLALALYGAAAIGCLSLVSSADFSQLSLTLAVGGLLGLAFSMASLWLLMGLAARIKTRTLLSGCLIYRMVRFLGRWIVRLLRYLPIVWRYLAIYGGISLLELIVMGLWGVGADAVLLWLAERVLGCGVICYVSLALRRLHLGAQAIAQGDYTSKISTNHLALDFKDGAETLNHIQDGMNAAVDSRLRSERMKTELITNVSHDLKTPLTSIVSYVDLLGQELRRADSLSPAAEEYLAVLGRQSMRLKKLIEDLVEASKAATGNLNLQLAPLDFCQLLEQALGEYQPRLEKAGLTLVAQRPEEPVMVLADGQRLWRVFDNLLSNAEKYALPGTRLYLRVAAGKTVRASFRNVSREPLDVSPEELMERFVRGDASRHTEGSGLGLSIARSLTESMGGHFELEVDGDLFKVTVSFPVLSGESDAPPAP